MLTYYAKRPGGEGFETTARPHEYTAWIHGSGVTQEELDRIVSYAGLSANIVRDVRDRSELPRIEYGDNDELYMFLRVPHLSKRAEVSTTPLLTILTRRRLFTLGHSDVFQADEITGKVESLRGMTTARLTLLVMAAVISEYETLVHRTSRAVRDVGARLRSHEVTNKDFVRFVTIEDNLNEYSTNLDGMQAIARHLHENRRGLFEENDLEMVDDIVLHIQQLLVAVQSERQSVTSIRNAYSTIANNTLNQRMKTLTVLTVLIALPNVFYGMYGMNVALPFADQPWAYSVVVLFTFLLIILVYILARRSKLF